MAQKSQTLLLQTPVFRMSYPNLLEPKPFENPKTGAKGDPKFSVQMLFDPDDLNNFKKREDDGWAEVKLAEALVEVAKAEWPDIHVKEAVQHGGLNWPIANGDEKKAKREAAGKKGEEYEGKRILSADTGAKYPPQLFVVDAGKYRELNRSSNEDRKLIEQRFVAGFYAAANVNLKAIETPQGRFLKFYLNAVVFVREGERIGGMSAEDRFDGIVGGEGDYDPTEGLDDEIPF